MFTQPRDPNNKTKPAHKKYRSHCHRTSHSISVCFKKQRDDEDKRDAFVFPQTTEQNDMIHDIEVEVHREITTIPKTTIHKLDVALHLEIDLVMTKILLIHNTLDQDLTILNETRDLIVLLNDPPTNHLIDVILVTDKDHNHTQETTINLRGTHLPLDHLQDLEILNFLDLAHIRIQELNSREYNHKLKTIQINLKYICITQPKWQTL